MNLAEVAVRGAAGVLLLLLIVLALREARTAPAARYGALFALSGIAYLVNSAPALAAIQYPWLTPAQLLSIVGPAIFWLWASAHFDDGFAPSWRYWLPCLALAAWGAAAIALRRTWPWHIVEAASLVFVGLGLWRVIASGAGDLVESRRRLRWVLAIGVAAMIAGFTILDVVVEGRPGIVANIATVSVLAALAFSFAVLRLSAEATPAAAPAAVVPRSAQPAPVPAADPDPEAAAVLARLRRLLDHDRIYREEGLSVAALAARLDVPEYRLRRLINQHLGYRNFTSFVNSYRLAEAKAALADPEQARVPVLTIALDAGFQSIGPFNRAFKADTGLTPSEYRRDRLAGRAQASAAE